MRVISNENEAWAYLKEWVAGTPMQPVSFSDWPRLEVHIVGDGYHSSLNTEQMEGYIAFQAVLNRSFCALKKGHYDSRYLTKSEEDALRIGVEVKEGSSVLETDLSPLVSAVSGSIGGASPNLVIAGLILVGLSITAIPVIKAILEFRTKKLDSTARKICPSS